MTLPADLDMQARHVWAQLATLRQDDARTIYLRRDESGRWLLTTLAPAEHRMSLEFVSTATRATPLADFLDDVLHNLREQGGGRNAVE